MSLNNSSANNFSSIDSEFSLNNTTNKNSVTNMNNNTKINTNEYTDFDLEAGASSTNVKAATPADQLSEADAVPTWEVITDRERELVQAANKTPELVVHKNTWLNFSIKTPNSADFYNYVSLINYQKGEVNRSQLTAEFGKFSMNYQSLNIVDGVASFSSSKPNGFSVECAVDFNKGLFSYCAKTTITNEYTGAESVVAISRSTQPLAIRKFAMVGFSAGAASVAGIYHAEQTFALFANLINGCWTVDRFKALMGKLKAKLVIDTLAQSELNGAKATYGRRGKVSKNNNQLLTEISIQSQIEAHKIGFIPVVFTIGSTCQYAINDIDGVMTGDKITIADRVFAPLGLPVHTDKNARKYLVYGKGSLASGLAYDSNGNLVSATPITDPTKGANRLASESFHHAINQSADWIGRKADEGEGETLGSGFTIALNAEATKIARPEGVLVPTTFAFSAFNLNNGIIETNVDKEVSFSYKVPKSIHTTINATEFIGTELEPKITEVVNNAIANSPKYLATSAAELAFTELLVDEIRNAIATQGGVLNASSITVAGVEVIKWEKDFDLELDSESLQITISKLTASGDVQEFNISVKATAHMVDKKSPKLRGNTKKGSAFPTNTSIVRKDGTTVDWTTLLTPETVKASKGLLELVANHSDIWTLLGVEEGSDLLWDAGSLSIGGHAFTPESLEQFVREQLCEVVTITHQVSQDELDLNPEVVEALEGNPNFTVSKPSEAGIATITERNVLAFSSFANYQVELSCADENSGAATLGVNEQIALSSYAQSLSDRLNKLSKQNTSRVQYMNADFAEAATVVQANDTKAVAKIAGMLNADNPKQGLMNLAKAYPGGVKFVADGFEAWCPFSALLHFTKWNGSFPGVSSTTSNNGSEEVVARSLAAQAIELIVKLNAINNGEILVTPDVLTDTYRDLFRNMSGVRGFLHSLRSRTKDFLKVGSKVSMRKARSTKKVRNTVIAHHQKVVGDLTIGYRDGLPVVRIHPENPMDIHVGDVVAISRCPLPMFTICKVELDDTLDQTVVAINPITWIKSNLGDFDGDTIYITELKRLAKGLNRSELTDLGVKYNNKYSAVATHWQIFDGDKAVSPLVADIIKNQPEAKITELTNFAVTINASVRAGNLVKVNNHYAYAVGQFFDIASALSESLGNKAFTGNEITDEDIIASHRAWIQYEEDGLGGFSEDHNLALETVKQQISDEVLNPGSLKPRKIRGRVVGDPSINFFAIQAAAIRQIGAKVLKDPTATNVPVEALTSQAFKRLSKADIKEHENVLWFTLSQKVSVKSLADTHRFGEQMVALGKVRAVFEEANVSLTSWK